MKIIHIIMLVVFVLPNYIHSQSKKKQIVILEDSLATLEENLQSLINENQRKIKIKEEELSIITMDIENKQRNISTISSNITILDEKIKLLSDSITSLEKEINVTKQSNNIRKSYINNFIELNPFELKTSGNQSELMIGFIRGEYLYLRSLLLTEEIYENGKLVRKDKTTRNSKYPFKIDMVYNSQLNEFLGEKKLSLLINDLEYNDEELTEFNNFNVIGNTITAHTYNYAELDKYTVYSITLNMESIVIKEYWLKTSMFPSNSESDKYEEALNNFMNQYNVKSFELKSVKTYSEFFYKTYSK